MKRFAFATIVAGGLAAATVGLAAPALAAPSGPGNAQDTVNSPEANGYKVILNKIGSAPLDQSTVTGVRPGQEVTQTVIDNHGHSFQKVLYTAVYVDVK
jgi:hypothetical protein